MKPIFLAINGLLLIVCLANAAEISCDHGDGPGTVTLPSGGRNVSLTQNASLSLAAGIFTCGNVTLGYTTDGWAFRRFSLVYEFDIESRFFVTSIDWGVRRFTALLDSVPAPIQVAVRLYTIPETSPFLFANLVPLDSVMVTITSADNPIPPLTGTPKSTIFSGDAWFLPVGKDLVVAIHYPSGLDATPAFRFSPSANSLGETLPSYVAFADCGYPEPVTPGQLGNTTPMLVMVVNGCSCAFPPGACCNPVTGECTFIEQLDCEYDWLGVSVPCNVETCPVPIATEPASWGRIKSLFR